MMWYSTFNDVIWFFQVIVQLLWHWNFNYQILSTKKAIASEEFSKGYEAFFKTFSHQTAAVAAATLKVNFFENPRPFSPLGLKISPSTTPSQKDSIWNTLCKNHKNYLVRYSSEKRG